MNEGVFQNRVQMIEMLLPVIDSRRKNDGYPLNSKISSLSNSVILGLSMTVFPLVKKKKKNRQLTSSFKQIISP